MSKNENLNPYEWIVVLSLISLLATITYFTHKDWLKNPVLDNSKAHYVYERELSVKVEGAVEFPGTMRVLKGSTIEDVLTKARPKPEADLKKVFLEKKVRDGQIITIPSVEMFTVQIKGSLSDSESIFVPKGTTLEDLINLVEWPESADLEKLKKKRKIKDGEIVKVGIKKKVPSGTFRKEIEK